MNKLYKILDPITDEVVYIGNTTLPLSVRLHRHLTKARRNQGRADIHAWMRKVLEIGLRPKIELIMEVDERYATESEANLIQGFKLVGHPLLNMRFM